MVKSFRSVTRPDGNTRYWKTNPVCHTHGIRFMGRHTALGAKNYGKRVPLIEALRIMFYFGFSLNVTLGLKSGNKLTNNLLASRREL
jgi:hypothetical protein